MFALTGLPAGSMVEVELRPRLASDKLDVQKVNITLLGNPIIRLIGFSGTEQGHRYLFVHAGQLGYAIHEFTVGQMPNPPPPGPGPPPPPPPPPIPPDVNPYRPDLRFQATVGPVKNYAGLETMKARQIAAMFSVVGSQVAAGAVTGSYQDVVDAVGEQGKGLGIPDEFRELL
ncbi:MAG: hypothetical protein ACYSWU_29495, partial [Planctomycetota bacterium]